MVTVVTWVEAWSKVAVMVVVSSFSLIGFLDSSKVTIGSSSSSLIINMTSFGLLLLPITTLPETVNFLSPS